MSEATTITVHPFPEPNRHRAHAPCNVESHFWRVDVRSASLSEPILYCPGCGWSYVEVLRDKEGCAWTAGDLVCNMQRAAGTARCAAHQER